MLGLPPERRRWAIMTIGISVGMATLDTAIANTALPIIAHDLHASPAASVWVVNAYQLAMIATLLPLAAAGDIVGHRRVYAWGIAIFTIASLGCALATSLPMLAFARVIQGFGASATMSVNTALIRFSYPPDRLGRGLGLNAMVVGVAFAVGPTVASMILLVAPWPYLFGVNVPFGVLAMALASRTLPTSPPSRYRFEPVAASLITVTFALLVLGLEEAAHEGSALIVAPLIAVSAVFAWVLLRVQAGHPAPMLPVDLFRRPQFALSSATAVTAFAAQGLAFVSLPFLFQHNLGKTVVETGFLMTPWPAITAIMAPIAGALSDRYPAGILGGIGMVLLSAGLASLLFLPADPDVLAIGWRMALCGAGFGFFQSPNLRAIMSTAPPERSGGASGIVAVSRLLGQTTGAALVAFCFAVSGSGGPMVAIGLGAGFAAVSAVISASRLAAPSTGTRPAGRRTRPKDT
jgi:MFS transporter, DHA2 family, multidrug resistance protein